LSDTPTTTTSFLFDKTIVVFTVRTAAGKLDMVFGTEGQQLVVDQLTAVITINAEQGKGAEGPDSGDLFLDLAVGAVA
jgi:hypothetical protein